VLTSVLAGVLTKEKDVTEYGCSTQEKIDQGKEGASDSFIQA
jgi:hypothetical protein